MSSLKVSASSSVDDATCSAISWSLPWRRHSDISAERPERKYRGRSCRSRRPRGSAHARRGTAQRTLVEELLDLAAVDAAGNGPQERTVAARPCGGNKGPLLSAVPRARRNGSRSGNR